MTGPPTDPAIRRVLCAELNEDGTVGGSHKCLLDLVRTLDRKRFEPTVLLYEHSRYVSLIEAHGIRVLVWNQLRERERSTQGKLARLGRAGTALRLLGAVWRRARFLKREGFDLVHLNNSPCFGFAEWWPAARLARTPIMAHARGPYDPPGSNAARQITYRFDRVLAISDFVKNDMIKNGIPESRIVRIYDGIDVAGWQRTAAEQPSAIRQELGLGNDIALILMVGHIKRWKGQHLLLAALAGMTESTRRRVHALFVGEPPANEQPYAEELRQFVAENRLGETVTFLGARPHVSGLMQASDIIVHASTVPEPFGLVVVEGMALGKPVIASRFGGPGEVIDADSGILFDPAQPEQLGSTLTALVNDQARRAQLGNAARRRVTQFDLTATTAAVQSAYEDVLSAR